MSFDLNIQNYRPEDVVALFKLPDTYCDADVEEKAQAIRLQLLTEEMPTGLKDEISLFLDAARDMIKRDWAPQPSVRDDVIPQTAVPFIPIKVEEFTKGDINPYAKRTMTKMASIDTLFRINSSTTSSTDFAYVLPESIRNVVSMRLAAVEIPNSGINTFTSTNLSNIFFLRLFRVKNEEDVIRLITIPDGNYTTTTIVTTMNNILQAQGAQFVIFELLPSLQGVFRIRNVGEGASPLDTSAPFYSPNFYFEIDFVVENKLLCASAGWALGFRRGEYENPQIVFNPESGVQLKNYYVSESFFGTGNDNYLFLEVDDFHNNFQTDTVISTNATSYMGKNILARVVLNNGPWTTVQNNGSDGIFRKREYLGPVRIEKLHFRLLNKFGEVVDLKHNNFSFALEFVTVYT